MTVPVVCKASPIAFGSCPAPPVAADASAVPCGDGEGTPTLSPVFAIIVRAASSAGVDPCGSASASALTGLLAVWLSDFAVCGASFPPEETVCPFAAPSEDGEALERTAACAGSSDFPASASVSAPETHPARAIAAMRPPDGAMIDLSVAARPRLSRNSPSPLSNKTCATCPRAFDLAHKFL
ncbi:MAG: hypothetical protein ACTHJ3_02245 [Pararhizobium sp.]